MAGVLEDAPPSVPDTLDLNHTRDPHGRDVLMLAAYHRCMGSLAWALGRGLDVTNVSDRGYTALHFAAASATGVAAAKQDDPSCVRALVGAGADVNAASKDGATPLHRAATYGLTAVAGALAKAAGVDLGAVNAGVRGDSEWVGWACGGLRVGRVGVCCACLCVRVYV